VALVRSQLKGGVNMVYQNNFIVVVKSQGMILRDSDGVVRLPFGSEYSVLLKNKDSRTAVAKVTIDGEDVMGGHKYIVPGNTQRELTGFLKGLKATHKFRFIKKTEEISRFRGDRIDDGIVRVEFWYEQVAQVIHCVTYSTGSYYFSPDYSLKDFRDCDTTLYGSSACPTMGSNIKSSDVSCFNNTVATPKSDEGITVKGTKANQDFQYGNVGALEFQSSVIVIRLKGQTRSRTKKKYNKVLKPVTVRTKIQCPTCGRRWKSYLKFCGNCSTALD
jgi:hypothetical protein